MKRTLFTISTALTLLLSLGLSPTWALERGITQKVIKTVVQLIAADKQPNGRLVAKWSGSGTIISTDGLILTNCHVAFPQAMFDDPALTYNVLIVALTIRSDSPPQPTYLAEVVQYNPNLDLAVVRVSRSLDGTPVDREQLSLPALPLGDSDALEIGDPLSIFGYPGIGGETITFTSGNVSGFTSERAIKGRAWIKTDATVAGGNSGGAAVDDQGKLVGIPTQIGAGSTDQVVDCRPYADTNGDGRIDEHDVCIPIGGFINALRPVNLAAPLIEAARRGLIPPASPTPSPSPEIPQRDPRVSRLFFAPAVNEYDQPTTVMDSFPSGTSSIYLFFDYHNFQNGVSWQPILSRNGQMLAAPWPLSPWNGGTDGQWWISFHENPIPDGDYRITITYHGQELAVASVQIGGPAEPRPAFRDIVFSADGQHGYLLPAGTGGITATFTYTNMTPTTPWLYRWSTGDHIVGEGPGLPLPESSGAASVSIISDQGLPAGSYRLELYIGEGEAAKLAATADATLTGAKDDRPLFSPLTFAEGRDAKGRPVRPGTSFASGITQLYAFFDYQGMKNGWDWAARWYLDGALILDHNGRWQGGERGDNAWVSLFGKQALPSGQYRLELLVKDTRIQTGTFTIGKGAQPRPTLPPRDGVEIRGRITDADSGQGIPGATIIVLQPGVTVDSFQWIEEEVYTWAKADRTGSYELPRPLARGISYSIIVGAKGYRPLAEDSVTIPQSIASPWDWTFALQKMR